MFLIPIPAFADNYLWWLHDGKRAVAVDRCDAKPVLRTLEERALSFKPILVTHGHADHTTSVDELRNAICAMAHGTASQRVTQVQSLFANGHPILPSAITREPKINPFMPTWQATIMTAAQRFAASVHGDTSLFAAIRQ